MRRTVRNVGLGHQVAAVAVAGAVALTAAACSGRDGKDDVASTASVSSRASDGPGGSAGDPSAPPRPGTFVLGAVKGSPQEQVFAFVAQDLADEAGLTVEVRTFDKPEQVWRALEDGEVDLDASYVQREQTALAREGDYPWRDGSHLECFMYEPLGVYSATLTQATGAPAGTTLGITDVVADQYRALDFLADANVTASRASTVTEMAGHFWRDLVPLTAAPADLAADLATYGLVVLDSPTAVAAGLRPADAVVVEKPEDADDAFCPAYNVDGRYSKDDFKDLVRLLVSAQTDAFITQTWPDGSVLPYQPS